MNLLFRVLYAQKCSSTHHRLAMDALRYVRLKNDLQWAQLFLARIQVYLDGSKASDRRFKDFRNHVLHVSDHFWGGAIPTASIWYRRLVDRLSAEDWGRAVYSAGVLSHYITDPMMPLHTPQTEEEAQVHRCIEWGTSRIYPQLVSSIAAARILQNWKPPQAASDAEWLSELLKAGATHARSYYGIGIQTVAELLDAKPEQASEQLEQKWITADIFVEWQQQAALVCRVPGLRGHDAQLLVGIGITQPKQLQAADAGELLLLLLIQEFSRTSSGERILRGSPIPDLAKEQRRQPFANSARQLRAA